MSELSTVRVYKESVPNIKKIVVLKCLGKEADAVDLGINAVSYSLSDVEKALEYCEARPYRGEWRAKIVLQVLDEFLKQSIKSKEVATEVEQINASDEMIIKINGFLERAKKLVRVEEDATG